MYRRKKSKKLVTPSKLQKCFDDVDDDAYSDSSRQGDDENVKDLDYEYFPQLSEVEAEAQLHKILDLI